jgi:multidrug efflux system membrane fusion protein
MVTVCCLTLPLLVILTACKQNEPAKTKAAARSRPPVPVNVAKVQARDLPITLESLGQVLPSAKVQVSGRVGGQLLSVHFQEGGRVAKGDLLFTIDPKPYEIAVKIAKANLRQSLAQLNEYQQEVKRRRPIVKRNFISQEDFDKLKTQMLTQSAAVEVSRANLQKAQLDLSYCEVRAPIGGTAGKLNIHPGSQISPGAGGEVVAITRTDPAYVEFSLPETDLPEVLEYHKQAPLKVQAWPSDQHKPLNGRLEFIASQVERDAGSIGLRAIFNNPGNTLWPGRSLRVALTLYVQKNALLAPSRAVQLSPKGQFVYVVGANRAVKPIPASILRIVGDMAVISGGIKPGDEVVTDGHLTLYPGAKVVIKKLPELKKSLKSQSKAK